MRIYDEAIPYLKETLNIDSLMDDTFNLAYDNQLLGTIYLNKDSLNAAKYHFLEAKRWASHMSETDVANMNVHLANIESRLNNVDSALVLIKELPNKVNPSFKNLALINASDIYLKAGILDSAYKYSYELVHSNEEYNKKNGFSNLLTPPLLSFTPKDSIVTYFSEYYDLLEGYYDKHESELSLIQVANYNYQKHDRERMIAEQKNRTIMAWCYFSIVLGLILLTMVLFYKVRSMQTTIQLKQALAKVSVMQRNLDKSPSDVDQESIIPLTTNNDDLRKKLKIELENLEIEGNKLPVSPIILHSAAYKKLQVEISSKNAIDETSTLWGELMDVILRSSPSFSKKITQLTEGRLKEYELNTIILIKCGVTPIQMTTLFRRSKSCISSRRVAICKKIIGEKIDSKLIDSIIYLL